MTHPRVAGSCVRFTAVPPNASYARGEQSWRPRGIRCRVYPVRRRYRRRERRGGSRRSAPGPAVNGGRSVERRFEPRDDSIRFDSFDSGEEAGKDERKKL
eukprot:30488-Pelagococcus_subviridis.AAC.4